MPTRFKYTKVQPESFALSPVEILLATDAELNQYVGLKKLAPYRKQGKSWDKTRVERLKEIKHKIKERSSALGAGEDLTKVLPEKPAKKRKGKKERMKEKAAAVQGVDLGEDGEAGRAADEGAVSSSSSNKRKATDEPEVSETAKGGESSKRKRRRHKKSAQEA